MTRIPPHNIEAEMAVLGSLIIGTDGNTLERLGKLTAEDFYRDAHGHIYRAMRSLMHDDEPVDIVTVQTELTRRNQLEQVGGYLYLVQLADFVPTVANLEHYAKIVVAASHRRQIIQTVSEVAGLAYGDDELDIILSEMERCVRSIREGTKRTMGDVCLLRDVAQREVEAIEQRFHNRMNGITLSGITSGLQAFDEMSTGLKPGEMTVIAARPGMGKSALAMKLIRSAADQGSVYFASLEMNEGQTAQRFLSQEARLDGYALRVGALERSDWESLQAALGGIWDLPIYISTAPALRPSILASRCRQIPGLSLVVVDYFQLMEGDDRGDRREMLDAVSRAIKTLALELDVPVVILAQLNRDVEKRPDKRPMMSDLRETGALEQDADNVVMLYRPGYYAQTPPDSWKADPTELLFRKQRNGPTGTVKVGFVGAQTTFIDIDPEEPDFPTEETEPPHWAK